ncbi:uncharacterized protein WM277_006289 isoform 1-T1 [Molossus nigricans]
MGTRLEFQWPDWLQRETVLWAGPVLSAHHQQGFQALRVDKGRLDRTSQASPARCWLRPPATCTRWCKSDVSLFFKCTHFFSPLRLTKLNHGRLCSQRCYESGQDGQDSFSLEAEAMEQADTQMTSRELLTTSLQLPVSGGRSRLFPDAQSFYHRGRVYQCCHGNMPDGRSFTPEVEETSFHWFSSASESCQSRVMPTNGRGDISKPIKKQTLPLSLVAHRCSLMGTRLEFQWPDWLRGETVLWAGPVLSAHHQQGFQALHVDKGSLDRTSQASPARCWLSPPATCRRGCKLNVSLFSKYTHLFSPLRLTKLNHVGKTLDEALVTN